MKAEEKYELVTIEGKKTGNILTQLQVNSLDNIPKGYYLPVVGVAIINNRNEILLQKRSKFKRANPVKWGICGGKINLGEDPISAGIRETMEEIGIKLEKEEFKNLNIDTIDKVHFTTYYVRKDINIKECVLQKEEVEELKYFKMEELKSLNNEGFEWLEDLKKIINK